MLDVSKVNRESINLRTNITNIKMGTENVRVPLLFNAAIVEFTEDLETVNLRWAFVYLNFIKAKKGFSKNSFLSPVVCTERDSGNWGEEDPLGVKKYEEEFLGITDFSSKCFNLMTGKFPVILTKGGGWLNPDLYRISVDLNRGYLETTENKERIRLDKLLDYDVFSGGMGVDTNHLYNLYPMVSGGTHSRSFIFSEDVVDYDVIVDRFRNTFYLRMEGTTNNNVYSSLNVEGNKFIFSLNGSEIEVNVDYFEKDRNSWLLIHLIENQLKKNVKDTYSVIREFTIMRGRCFPPSLESSMEVEEFPKSFSFIYNGHTYKAPYPFITPGGITKTLVEYNNLYAKTYLQWFERLQGEHARINTIKLMDSFVEDFDFPVFVEDSNQVKIKPYYYPVDVETRMFLGEELRIFYLVLKLISFMRDNSVQVSNYFGASMNAELKHINPLVFKRGNPKQGTELTSEWK